VSEFIQGHSITRLDDGRFLIVGEPVSEHYANRRGVQVDGDEQAVIVSAEAEAAHVQPLHDQIAELEDAVPARITAEMARDDALAERDKFAAKAQVVQGQRDGAISSIVLNAMTLQGVAAMELQQHPDSSAWRVVAQQAQQLLTLAGAGLPVPADLEEEAERRYESLRTYLRVELSETCTVDHAGRATDAAARLIKRELIAVFVAFRVARLRLDAAEAALEVIEQRARTAEETGVAATYCALWDAHGILDAALNPAESPAEVEGGERA
jgi:hypothetical protein